MKLNVTRLIHFWLYQKYRNNKVEKKGKDYSTTTCKTNSFTQLETCITRNDTKTYLLKISSPQRITKLLVTVLVLNACKKRGNNTTNQTPFRWNYFWWHKRKLIGTTKFWKNGFFIPVNKVIGIENPFDMLYVTFLYYGVSR